MQAATTISAVATAWPRSRLRPSPALVYITLHALALWPQFRWAWARVRDGSDDPLGLVALGALILVVARHASALRQTPRPAWMGLALVLLVSASVATPHLPPLLAALLGMLSLVAGLAAWLPTGTARLPLAGLAVLALPLISSLQFYAGFPLRIVTAELSAWLLRAMGFAAERSGASMTIEGQLVIVDAPCSGVQLAWMAYFCACALAALRAVPDRALLSRLPLVGVLVIAGNAVRNLVLVLLEIRPQGLDDAAHEAVGLAALGVVCLLVMRLIPTPVRAESRFSTADAGPPSARSSWMYAIAPLLVCGALLARASIDRSPATPARNPHAAAEWPRQWDGKPLRPLALSAVEKRFAERFPGRIARFGNGSKTLVLRDVEEPTRMLHPAADCYRGLGYRVDTAVLEHDGEQRLWRCFIADRDGQGQRVCEQILDADGQVFTDASAWYWTALLGQSRGPWRAVTRAEAL